MANCERYWLSSSKPAAVYIPDLKQLIAEDTGALQHTRIYRRLDGARAFVPRGK